MDAGVGEGVADRGDDGSFTPGQFVGHASCGFDTPRIVPFAKGLYHNRNRVYVPEIGRFAQADPNASGQTLLDLPVYHGSGFSEVNINYDVQARYTNGGSLYGYMGSNSWARSDVMGLFFGGYMSGFDGPRGGANDPFNIVDEYIHEDIAQKAAFLEQAQRGFDSAMFVAAQIAQMYPPIAVATTMYSVATTGQVRFSDVVNLIPFAKYLRIQAGISRLRTAYASTSRAKPLANQDAALASVSRMYEHVGKMGRYDDLTRPCLRTVV